MSPEAPHLSIGEVLAQLRDEFPDITISKIRFLESQGLIDPERTPSGYRKFYDDDLVRLRWILFQQKEHFLPLKVIKERLDELPPGDLSLLDPASALDLDPGAAPDVEGEAADAPADPEPEPSPAPAAAPVSAAPEPPAPSWPTSWGRQARSARSIRATATRPSAGCWPRASPGIAGCASDRCATACSRCGS